MKIRNQILRDPDPAAAPGGSTSEPVALTFTDSWHKGLDDGCGDDPSITKFKTPTDLAKGYQQLSSKVGAMVTLPGVEATDEDRATFFNRLGRPESATEYSHSESVKLPEGVEIPEDQITGAKDAFHKLGLTKDQGQGVLDFYYNTVISGSEQYAQQLAADKTASDEAMNTAFGDKKTERINVAEAVVKELGLKDGDIAKLADSFPVESSVGFVKLLNAIAPKVLDASAYGGDGGMPRGPGYAQATIERLSVDTEFQAALTNRNNPGHKEALRRWEGLMHEAAGTQHR